MSPRRLIADEMESHVAMEPNTGCWLWLRGLTAAGYAMVSDAGDLKYGHRLMYERTRGPIPSGLVVDHMCRTRCCINPDHMRLLTRGQNVTVAGSLSPSGRNAAKSHCPRCGSEYTADGFSRRCMPCRRIKDRLRAPRTRRVAA